MTTSAPLPDRIERLSALAQALVGDPSSADVARLLAMRIFDSWGCRGVLILHPLASGALRLDAYFGYTDSEAERLRVLPFDAESPMHRAMSTDDVLWYPDTVDVQEAVGQRELLVTDTNALIVMPVTHVGVPLQVLLLCFSETLPSNPASEPFVNAVRNLLELHAGTLDIPAARSSNAAASRSDVAVTLDDVELSPRQTHILQMLAQGRTNRSIAAELGFSESTIRQETLRLYRALEVNSRTDAVRVARAIGLLAQE